MLDDLRAWLNGDRDYNAGVLLYAKAGNNEALKKLFAKGKTDYCYERLQAELLKICRQLKQPNAKQSDNAEPSADAAEGSVHLQRLRPTDSIGGQVRQSAPEARGQENSTNKNGEVQNPNPALYQVCKAEADKSYKEVMNLRAELFALARPDEFSDPNTPDRIQQRSKLAVKVAEAFKNVSQLYDRADYVRMHGRLPDQGEPDSEELDPDGLPDHLVKQTLDNLRKNYNKMKKREQTPERVALLQKHEVNIEKLEARWLLLKPAK